MRLVSRYIVPLRAPRRWTGAVTATPSPRALSYRALGEPSCRFPAEAQRIVYCMRETGGALEVGKQGNTRLYKLGRERDATRLRHSPWHVLP